MSYLSVKFVIAKILSTMKAGPWDCEQFANTESRRKSYNFTIFRKSIAVIIAGSIQFTSFENYYTPRANVFAEWAFKTDNEWMNNESFQNICEKYENRPINCLSTPPLCKFSGDGETKLSKYWVQFS